MSSHISFTYLSLSYINRCHTHIYLKHLYTNNPHIGEGSSRRCFGFPCGSCCELSCSEGKVEAATQQVCGVSIV